MLNKSTLAALVGAAVFSFGAVLADHHQTKPAADSMVKDGAESKPDEKPKWDVNNPGGNWKTISIDTNEVTWANVDVSPDGQHIIFDAVGDIYRMPIGGGTAEPLTTGIAFNVQAKYSPDGQHIVFISDRDGADNIWVMKADGSDPKQISKEKSNLLHNPAWTPDGQWVIARKGYVSTRSIPSAELWRYHRSGGSGVQVVKRPHGEQSQKNIAEPAYSPDGRYLYYTQDTTSGRVFQYNRDALSQIYIIQRLDRERDSTEAFVTGPGGAIRPTPSPDGKTLAFIKRLPNLNSAIYLKDLESGNERMIFDALDRDEQEGFGVHGVYPAMSWTPDSGALVFWAGGKIRRISASGGDATEIALRLTVDKQVRETVRFDVDVAPDEFPVRMTRWAQYSPDGSTVVFQALGHLYVKDVASGRQKRLTRQDDHHEFWPSFSADGRSIVYTTWNDESLGSVRVVSSNGGRGRVITNRPGHYIQPKFSPDGSQVVFRKISGGYLLSPTWSQEPGIYRVGVRGGDPIRVNERGDSPQFSADGQRILFSLNTAVTQLALNSVNLDGLDPRTHAQAAKGIEFSVSPDGNWLAFVEQYNVHVLPFPMTGQNLKVSAGMKSLPVKKVSDRAGQFIHWSADSTALAWSNASTLYRRDLSDAFSFLEGAPAELPEPVTEGLDLSFTVAADKPNSMIALTGARIVTMRNAETEQEVIENGVVLVRDNRIEAVGSADSVTIPADAFKVDVTGKTILPGLVDGHSHGGVGRQQIIPQQNWMQLANLAFGVTTTHDPSNNTAEIFAFSELQRTGQTLGPRTYSTGRILYGALAPGATAKITDLESAEFHVRRLADAGAISVKSYNQLGRDSRQQVIAAAEELGIMVVPEGGGKYLHNINHIVDGHTSVEHAIPLANLYDDIVQLWSQTDTVYSPTFGVAYGGIWGENYWYDTTDVFANERLLRYTPKSQLLPRSMRRVKAPEFQYNHKNVARQAKKLRDAGVPVTIGAHGQRAGLAAHWEMWMMEQGGFTPWEALRGGTIDVAAFIGMADDIGSIEVGKLADLIVIDGNPLQDLRRSEYVTHTMINGRLYDVSTMNEVGSGDYRRQPLFFEREGGDAYPASTARAIAEKAEQFHWSH